jgi:hypothetical protein
MKDKKFDLIFELLNGSQKEVVKYIKNEHPDVEFRGGSPDTHPLRIPLFAGGNSFCVINTRKREALLRLEFRSRDYNGPFASPTRHKNFDRKFDIVHESDKEKASKIISKIKSNYSNKILPQKSCKDDINLHSPKMKSSHYAILSVMGPHAGEDSETIFSRKINDIISIGRTFWVIQSYKAKPESVQQLCQTALDNGQTPLCIFLAPSSTNGAKQTKTSSAASAFSPDQVKWLTLPKGLSPVTGNIKRASALVFDELKMIELQTIDLWQYADFIDPNLPVKTRQGVSTLCAVRQDTKKHPERMKSRFRQILAIGRLIKPYAVWLR